MTFPTQLCAGLSIINHDKKGSLFIKQAGFHGTYLAGFFFGGWRSQAKPVLLPRNLCTMEANIGRGGLVDGEVLHGCGILIGIDNFFA